MPAPRLFLAAVLTVWATCTVAMPAAARSLALIVGNDSYEQIPPLRKARADAGGYAEFFRDRGFEVTLRTDLDARDMVVELAAFYDSIAPGDVVAFVYSGHGWSDGRENFLLPTDIRAEGSPTLLAKESFALRNGVNGILDEIARRGPSLTLAVIDACRNNPFTAEGTRSVGLSRGLVAVAPPEGTFIAFSAGEGQAALDALSPDDDVPYSVFTRHFLSELEKPQDLLTAFKATQIAVSRAAQGVGRSQRPAYYDEVVGLACLSGGCGAPLEAAAGAGDDGAAARLEWQDFKDSTSPEALAAFAERHAGTPYAALAAERIARLLAERAAAEKTLPQGAAVAAAPPLSPEPPDGDGTSAAAAALPAPDAPAAAPADAAAALPAPDRPAEPAIAAAPPAAVAQGDGERERAAAALIREFNRLWSGPNAAALAGIEKMYDGPVTYFGKRLSQAEVLADKRAFAARWPERTYALIEDTFDIACEGDLCRVRVEVEWSSRAPDRGASSRGRAQSEVGLRWTGDRFIIVEENGRVLERY